MTTLARCYARMQDSPCSFGYCRTLCQSCPFRWERIARTADGLRLPGGPSGPTSSRIGPRGLDTGLALVFSGATVSAEEAESWAEPGEERLKRTGCHLAAGVVAAVVVGLLGAPTAGANHTLKEEISIGPNGGNGALKSFFDANSQDGTHAVFETSESLVASDTDAVFDIYERVGNTTSLVSIGPSGGNGASDAFFDGISDDGS